jgi:sugar/nucleoside kinase (ribokinase family)
LFDQQERTMSHVYLYGMISPSTVHVLREDFTFPRANEYAEIANSCPSVGGEAANSAFVLAKLGVPTKLDGNWLNPRDADKVLGLLKPFGIDTSRLSIRSDGGTSEIVIADRTTRTVFGNYASFHSGPKQWNDPQPEDIERASVACLDPYFRDESRKAAELCVAYRKPYVTLDCPYDDAMAQHAACIVISHELRDQTYPARDHRELFDAYRAHCDGLVIFTFGSEALWYARKQEEGTFVPYRVEPVDTTGAGDAFRGAIAYGILQQWSDAKTVEFASAVAACVCLTSPHALNAPNLETVLEFMAQHRAQR